MMRLSQTDQNEKDCLTRYFKLAKIKEEVLAEELEEVTKENETKEALISKQKQCIVVLESHIRQ
jgi:hypothetical protein